MTAGIVSPVTNLSCSGGLLSAINVTWTLPIGGLTRTSYRWTVSGGAQRIGDAP